MNTTYHFRNHEDAVNLQKENQGRIHDNRHSCADHSEKQFTVVVKSRIHNNPLDELVYLSKADFEDWLSGRDWTQQNKDLHLSLFTGCLYFDEDGFFDHR